MYLNKYVYRLISLYTLSLNPSPMPSRPRTPPFIDCPIYHPMSYPSAHNLTTRYPTLYYPYPIPSYPTPCPNYYHNPTYPLLSLPPSHISYPLPQSITSRLTHPSYYPSSYPLLVCTN